MQCLHGTNQDNSCHNRAQKTKKAEQDKHAAKQDKKAAKEENACLTEGTIGPANSTASSKVQLAQSTSKSVTSAPSKKRKVTPSSGCFATNTHHAAKKFGLS